MSARRAIAFVLIWVTMAPIPAVATDYADVRAEFELIDGDGRHVSHMDFRGRYVLLAFGFTNCPHVCPMMVANMAGALNIDRSDATGVFISVDTERDSPEKVHAYASSFGEKMIGLGGDYHQVNAAAENFSVTYVVSKSQKSYSVQHTSSIFVIDPAGQVVEIFPLNARPTEIAAAMGGSD